MYEIVDRDCERVDGTKHDSKKIKLTEVSKSRILEKIIDVTYSSMGKTEKEIVKVGSDIEETRKKQENSIEHQGIMATITFSTLKFVEKALIRKEARLANKFDRESRRAAALQKELEKNIPDRFIANLNEFDVNKIDSSSLANSIENAFYNDIQKVNEVEQNTEITETDTMIKDDSLDSVLENEDVSNFEGLLANNINKKEFVQDNLDFVPDFQQIFDSIPKFDSISEQEKEIEKNSISIHDDSNVNTVNEEIFSKINDSLNDENITSSDLAKLREELEEERNKKNKLTEELEEKIKRAAIIEKETAAALQEQKEKMKLVRDKLESYKEENKRLETQAQQVEEDTQRQISIRQQSLDYINSLNEMMNPNTINKSVVKESIK